MPERALGVVGVPVLADREGVEQGSGAGPWRGGSRGACEQIGYGVSNYDAAAPNYPVTFTPRSESCYAEVGQCSPSCP